MSAPPVMLEDAVAATVGRIDAGGYLAKKVCSRGGSDLASCMYCALAAAMVTDQWTTVLQAVFVELNLCLMFARSGKIKVDLEAGISAPARTST